MILKFTHTPPDKWTREAWATDFLNETHKALNEAAIDGDLTTNAARARSLIGQALTEVEFRPDKGYGPWPAHCFELICEAQDLLTRTRDDEARTFVMFKNEREYCATARRLLEEARGIAADFNIAAEDTEAPGPGFYSFPPQSLERKKSR